MIHVSMREQDQIDGRKFFPCQCGGDESFGTDRKEPKDIEADPLGKDRVGDDPCAIKIDQHRGVPDPCSGDGVVLPGGRVGTEFGLSSFMAPKHHIPPGALQLRLRFLGNQDPRCNNTQSQRCKKFSTG